MANEKGNSGRKSKDGDRQKRPLLLRGLFVCPEHGRQLVVGGVHGSILFCPLCRAIKAETRPLFTYLNRALALRLTCETLAELVRADDGLVADIISACQREAETAQKPDPEVLKRLRAQANKLSTTIDFNRRNPGETEEDQRQTEQLLKELRRQRTSLLAELAAREAASKGTISIPEPEEVRVMLDELGEILTAAASAETDGQMRTARRIIDELTGGRIELCQMGERKAQRGWLQGRFYVDLISVAIARLTGVRLAGNKDDRVEIVIDYRAPRVIDEQADEAKRLWDQGLLNKEIAERMGCLRWYVTKLLHHWFDKHDLPRPDGRRRRAQLANKQSTTPADKQLADRVVRLVEQGYPNLAIARQFNVSDATVAKAISWWFESRGFPVPTAADRRLKKLQRAKAMYDGGMLIADIADKLDYTPRGLELALEKHLAELGQSMPDGRARRGNANSGENASGHAIRDDGRREDET